MTLTDKEKKIVLIKYIIHGVSPFSEAPLGTRIKMLKAAVENCGMIYDEDELMLIGQECIDLQSKLNNYMMKFIESNDDLLTRAHIEINKGNESLKKELGDEVIDESKKLLDNPKWYDRFR